MDNPVDIPFPPSSTPGRKPQEAGGQLINGFFETPPEGAGSDTLWVRSPGLRQILDATSLSVNNIHTRGFLDCGSTMLWMVNNRVLAVTRSGSVFTVADVGALSGSLPVTVARNNNAVPQNLVVTDNGCFNLFTGSAPTAFADLDLPANPTSVCFTDGYFVWSFGDGRIFASDLNAVSVAANSFNTEQALFVKRVIPFAGRLFAFGNKWTGVYKNAGLSPFPFSREVQIPRGIIGTHAISGADVGWANELIWAADDFIVYRLNGYTPVPLSNDDVSRSIEASVLAGHADNLEASVYMYGRNIFWVLTDPDNWTWEFNLFSQRWNQRQSSLRDDWRGRRSIRMFDRWLMGEITGGKLFEVTGDYFREASDPLLWSVISGLVSGFPNGMVIPEAAFGLTVGVGSLDTEDDPQVRISWSLDGGASYGNPILRRLGGPGETNGIVRVRNCGLSRGQGVRFKLEISDPVHVGLSGGRINPVLRTTG